MANVYDKLKEMNITLPARTAMGVNVCPGNIPVEIEMLVEYE